MRAHEIINEAINPDILDPRFTHTQEIGDFTYTAASSMESEGHGNYLVIKAYEDLNDPLGHVAQAKFFIRGTPESGYLESLNTWVAREYREKGIARTMYAYAKMLGNTVKPSSTQTDMGKGMWAAWKKSGDAEHLMKEEVNPSKQDLKDVADWMNTTPDKLSIELKQEPIEKFIKQIREMYSTYDEFPEDEDRTNRILKLLTRGAKPLPIYVEATDPDLFVMEGRHRMVAFWLAGMKTIPVAYASIKTNQQVTEDEPALKLSDNGRAKAVEWINKVYAKYPATFQNNHVMTWGEGDAQQFAMFELTPSLVKRGAVEVKWFQAYPLRQGVGGRAMKELQALAQEDGITLTLFPWDKGQVSQSKLTKFYKGQGYKPVAKGSKSMYWSPESSKLSESTPGMFSKVMTHETSPEAAAAILRNGFRKSRTGIFFNVEGQNYSGGGYGGSVIQARVSGPVDDILDLSDDNDLPDDLDEFAEGEEIADYARSEGYWAWTDGVQFAVLDLKHIQLVNQSSIKESLSIDVPNDSWLQDQIDYAKSKPRNRWGVPYMGKTTARTASPVIVPVDILKRLPGMRGEQENVRQDDLSAIMDIMQRTGKLPLHNGKEYVPFINVAYNGEAWVNEGNHRIMAAAALGWRELPVEISYFDGGERKYGAMAPERIGL